MHRKRAAARGLVRLEVQARSSDVEIIRAVAELLRRDDEAGQQLRGSLKSALTPAASFSALDAFATDLPDELFEGVFDQPREQAWRDVSL
jgi:hypothetical protein